VTRLSHLQTSAIITVALFVGMPLAAAKQTPGAAAPNTKQAASGTAVDESSSQGNLDGARRALDRVNSSSLSGEAAKKIAELRRDFNDLAAAYGTSAASTTGGAATGSAVPPTGGSTGTDWRAKYTLVDNAVLALIGSSTNAAPSDAAGTSGPAPGVANLDATVRGQLQEFRSQLQRFYAKQIGQAPQPTASGTKSNGVDVLLDRMASIIDAALAGRPGPSSTRAVGTSGTTGSLGSAGKVTIERQQLDEIRAEIEQLRSILQVEKP
jgi:hypothetical protein